MSNVRKKCKKRKEGAYNKETSPGVFYELNKSLVGSEVSELLMWALDMLDRF